MNRIFKRAAIKLPLREGGRVIFDKQNAQVAFVTSEAVMLLLELMTEENVAANAAETPRPAPFGGAMVSSLGEGGIWLTWAEVLEAWRKGRLVVLDQTRPNLPSVRSPEEVLAVCPPKAAKRLSQKLVYVQAMQRLIDKGLLNVSDDDSITGNRPLIHGTAIAIEAEAGREKREQQGLRPHAAAKLEIRLPLTPPASATLVHYWKTFQTHGAAGLVDNYHKCGNHLGPYSAEVRAFLAGAVRAATREERPPITVINQRVTSDFERENERRKAEGWREPRLEIPKRDAIRRALLDTGLMEYALRTRGRAGAERAARPVGQGPKADRALQTAVMDEWTTDTKTLFEGVKLWDHLTDDERAVLLKDAKPKRIVLSGAIDLATNAILSVQFAFTPSANLTARAIEMMMMDKSAWAGAVHSALPWPMQGLPESIVMDRGPSYNNASVYAILAALRINYLGCVAEMPHLKGIIERFFLTAHNKVLSRLGGRTFSNPYFKGDYDDDAKARLTPERLIKALLRFIIDIHNNTPHPALDGRTPLQAWNAHMEDGFAVRLPPDTHEMRMVFGTLVERRLTAKGLQVAGITYQTDDLARLYLRRPARDYRIRWWPHDVGAIEVQIGPEEWMTVMALEERFIGKTFEEVRPLLQSGPLDPELQRVQREAYEYIDEQDPEAAALRQLFEATWTPERIARFEEKLLRHLVTAERTERLGAARPLLGDTVKPLPGSDEDPAASESRTTPSTSGSSDASDLME